MKTAMEQALQELEQYLQEQPERAAVQDYLRNTPLPFIACYADELSAKDMFDYAFRYLHVLGQYNVALSVGLAMNTYISLSIACLPAQPGTPIAFLKQQFLALVKQNRWILAVSSFDDFIRAKDEPGHQVFCETQPDGTIRCNGVKNFQSNISDADLLLFSGVLDNRKVGLFYTFLKQTPGITLGDSMYPGAMADTDTRPVFFKDLVLTPFQSVPSDDGGENVGLHTLTRVIFAVMAMAPYLGGARRALDEAAAFLRSVQVDGVSLAELDGYVTDMGRNQIQYLVCMNLAEGFAHQLQSLQLDNLAQWLTSEAPKAMAVKHHVTAVCEQLVDNARKIIGTRSLLPGHIVSQLSQQVLFAALHPVLNAKIERELGAAVLKKG